MSIVPGVIHDPETNTVFVNDDTIDCVVCLEPTLTNAAVLALSLEPRNPEKVLRCFCNLYEMEENVALAYLRAANIVLEPYLRLVEATDRLRASRKKLEHKIARNQARRLRRKHREQILTLEVELQEMTTRNELANARGYQLQEQLATALKRIAANT